jgi:hypothetical protein
MVSNCANPACAVPFQYLREGKLFRIAVTSGLPREGELARLSLVEAKPGPQFEHFWLCGSCSNRLTLGFEKRRGIVLLPLQMEAHKPVAS